MSPAVRERDADELDLRSSVASRAGAGPASGSTAAEGPRGRPEGFHEALGPTAIKSSDCLRQMRTPDSGRPGTVPE